MNRILIILVSLILFSCSQIQPINSSVRSSLSGDFNLHFSVEKKVLPNGLTVLLVNNGDLPIFSYYTFFKVGGKYEVKGITGASHFLEHLMFKGSQKFAQGRFDQIIEGNGGWSNAYTTNDATVYFENMPLAALDQIIEVEADRMQNLLLAPDSFESERQVILEERKMRYENRPAGQAHLAMMENIFAGTPYGQSVIGDIPDLKSVSRDQIYDYFKKFYAPNNALIVVVGKIDTQELMKKIEKHFASIPASTHLSKAKKVGDHPDSYKAKIKFGKHTRLHGNSPTPMFHMAFEGEALGTKRSYVLDILSSILGDGSSSYLQQKWVYSQKPQLAAIGASNYTLMNSGVFYFSGRLLKSHKIDPFLEKFKADFPRFCDDAITERSLQRTKNQYLVGYLKELESNAGVARFLGDREFYFGNYQYYQEELDAYERITTDEVKKACYELFKKPRYILVSIWDKY